MAVTAIFGGTFNPFHIGHYEILKHLQNCNSIDKILVMPDNIPPHKVCDYLAKDDFRIQMCKIACSDFSKAETCLIEFERQGKSYSYDTVIELKQKYPNTKFAFVCGADMLISLDKWYRYKDLINEVSFLVFKRIDKDYSDLDFYVSKYIEMGAEISIFDDKITGVSSTYIRNNIENSENLLPCKIYKFIKNKGIYYGKA